MFVFLLLSRDAYKLFQVAEEVIKPCNYIGSVRVYSFSFVVYLAIFNACYTVVLLLVTHNVSSEVENYFYSILRVQLPRSPWHRTLVPGLVDGTGYPGGTWSISVRLIGLELSREAGLVFLSFSLVH